MLFVWAGFIAHVNAYHKTEFQCLDGSVPKFLGGGFDKVVAVLAAQSSSVTLQVIYWEFIWSRLYLPLLLSCIDTTVENMLCGVKAVYIYPFFFDPLVFDFIDYLSL